MARRPLTYLLGDTPPSPKKNHETAEAQPGDDDAAAARAARQDRRQTRKGRCALSGLAVQSGAVRAGRGARGISALGQRNSSEVSRALPADGGACLRRAVFLERA